VSEVLKQKETLAVSVDVSKPIDELLAKQWLLSNGRGGYASSTVAGCNTSRYHGLLIGSLNPPAGRIMALANCLEQLIRNGRTYSITTLQFADRFAPAGFRFLSSFREDAGVHFDYQCDDIRLTKSIYLPADSDSVLICYRFDSLAEPVDFVVRPFVGLRDFHLLQKSYARLYATETETGLLVRHDVAGSCELLLGCGGAEFVKDPQWWFNFLYTSDRERGQDFSEDLWTPGFFKVRIDTPREVVFRANFSSRHEPGRVKDPDIEAVRDELNRRRAEIVATAGTDRTLAALFLAAEQFVVRRRTGNEDSATILAGYPWFGDWGRDAFIALPGLLLAPKRHGPAKSVLATFAKAAEGGMIPNCFDDYSRTACFNSVDASLWFINAAFCYLEASNNTGWFSETLLPVIQSIIEAYRRGTRFDIHADADGLITAGDAGTQLTWMDAKYAGRAFTPRHGKPVEVNALWYNALMLVAGFLSRTNAGDSRASGDIFSMAQKVRDSFYKLFWNQRLGYLNDCIFPDGSPDATLRPNQIFAVSLPFSPLGHDKQKAVVEIVREKLLTPYGLRTLPPDDRRYKGIYTGPRRQRDEAYHQGTVWPWLMGAFVEAYLKVNDFSQKSKTDAAGFIEPLLVHLTQQGCIGQVCEIFDGEPPHRPRGCFAQAWSVAELLRAYLLIHG